MAAKGPDKSGLNHVRCVAEGPQGTLNAYGII